jgi:hypothetical protein
MSTADRKPVTLLPVSAFLLELHSERMIDVMHALKDAGFTVTAVRGRDNRYQITDRVDDAKEQEQ